MGWIIVLLWLCLFGAIGAFCWTYALNAWLVFLGKAAVIVWWQGFLLGFCPWIGKLSIPAAVITWILMLILM